MEFSFSFVPELKDSDDAARRVTSHIMIDPSQTKKRQRESIIYEFLGSVFHYTIAHEKIQELANDLNELLEQWEYS
jgi:hypothetical protein